MSKASCLVWLASSGDSYLAGEEAEDRIPIRELIRHPKLGLTRNDYELHELGLSVGGSIDEAIIAILQEAVSRTKQATLRFGSLDMNLSCPSQWRWSQRQRLLSLASAADINTRGRHILIDEPVAAGVGWVEWMLAMGHWRDDASRILVVDVGGGTVDVALVDVVGGATPEFRVLASVGREWGGHRVDELFGRHIAREIGLRDLADALAIPGYALTEDLAILLLETERVKRLLSSSSTVPIDLSSQIPGSQPADIPVDMLKEASVEYIKGIIDFSQGVARQGLFSAGWASTDVIKLGWEDLEITDILLVGGGSRLRGMSEAFRTNLPWARVSSEESYQAAEEMVVRGLTFPEEYFAMSLDRPHFSIHIEFNGTRHTLYHAYDPLYTPALAITNSVAVVSDQFKIPQGTQEVTLVLETTGGEELRSRSGLDLRWSLLRGDREIFSSFYSTGLLILRSKQQVIVRLRLPYWNPLDKDFVEVVPEQTGKKAMFDNPFQEGAPG